MAQWHSGTVAQWLEGGQGGQEGMVAQWLEGGQEGRRAGGQEGRRAMCRRVPLSRSAMPKDPPVRPKRPPMADAG